MQPHQVSGAAGASAAQLQMHLQQMQAQALRQQQNVNQQQHLMSNGGFGNMSHNVQQSGHFGGQQVDQSHQQGNSQMGQRNSFTSPPNLMGAASGGMPNSSGMCMVQNHMGGSQQMMQGQPSQGGSGQKGGAQAALLAWNAVQASNPNKPGGNMGGNGNPSNMKLGMMGGNSQMQGMSQHPKQGGTQGFNGHSLQPNFNAPVPADGNSNNELVMQQQIQMELIQNLNNPAASNNNALLLQQQNLISQLMRRIQTQSNNSGNSNSQTSQQGMQFPNMNQRPGSSMGPSGQMQRTSATSDMLQQSMNSLLQGNANNNPSNSGMSTNNQQQKSGDFPFPYSLQRQHSNQQPGLNNPSQNNSAGSSDVTSFGANMNSNSGNSSNMGSAMNLPLSKNLSQGQPMSFDGHGAQGFGMNQLLPMMNQNRPSSATGSQGSQHSMMQKDCKRKLLQNPNNEKKRQRSGDLHDDSSVNSIKEDDDSSGKPSKGKNSSKGRKKNTSKSSRKTSSDSSSINTESSKSKSGNDRNLESNESGNGSDSFLGIRDANGRNVNPQNRGAQQGFLDGNFAGGWQSNADLPNRKRIIISIVRLVERMRPDANRMSQKLPLMAKRLEEYLYRAATTKEEYMDSSTLKRRLQRIAHGLGTINNQSSGQERPSSNSSRSKSSNGNFDSEWFPNLLGGDLQDKAMQGKEAMMRDLKKNSGQINGIDGKISRGQRNTEQQEAEIRLKSIKQQQQRLYILRHASKCKEGPKCKVKWCDKMVALWKHMKTCRDKSCKTQHCLSSRCVLQHYRVCKSNKRTDKCEICGPVMKRVSGDQEVDSFCIPINFGEIGDSQGSNDALSLSNKPVRSSSSQLPNTTSSSGNVTENSKHNLNILEEIKAAQNKIRQQQILLQQLQNQQLQFLEQQKNSPQPRRGQQQLKHQQQQQFMQQIQQQFQPQQHFCQRELERQMRELERQLVLIQRKQQLLHRDSGNDVKGDTLNNVKVKDEEQDVPETTSSQVDGKETKRKRRSGTGSSGEQGSSRKNSKTAVKKLRNPNKCKSSKNSEKNSSLDGEKSDDKDLKEETSVSSKSKNSSNKDSTSGSSKTKGESSSRPSSAKRRSSSLSKNSSVKKGSNEVTSSIVKKENKENSKSVPSNKSKSKVKEEPEQPTNGEKHKKENDGAEKPSDQGDSEMSTSLIPSMSLEAVQEHIDSLPIGSSVSPRKISQKCLPIVRKLITDQFGWVFRDPVDPDELGLPDYFNVVENPMDLGKIEKQLENHDYKDFESFEKHVRLVFENAILYNGDNSDVGDMAKSLLTVFEEDFKALMKVMETDQQNAKRRVDACILCNSHRRLFEPTILYCNGICGMQRIRRNATYYTDKSKLNHWCTSCYSSMEENDKNILDNGKEVYKKDLQKLKNDALAEEAWVQCDVCHNWVHQICALFNGRKNKTSASYTCPKCHIKNAKHSDIGPKKGIPSFKKAKDLPHCNMSKYIEKGILETLDKEYLKRAHTEKCSPDEVEKVNDLSVRVVSSMEKTHFVREKMLERYGNKGYPSEFPVKTKCLLLFQTIHGIDTLLLGMYVHEYGNNCPLPNRRRVYISYLDSVYYFQPKWYRTLTYHTMLIEYLRFVKQRGFHTAHIWSCPPSKGDDYIFHIHPSSQLTPSDDMLCQWYEDMLKKAKDNGVVVDSRTLFEEYFDNDCLSASDGQNRDPCCLPYFEGDYLTGEIENILKNLETEEEGKIKGREGLTSLSRRAANSKKKVGNKLGTRSNPGELVNQGRDKVMLRLSQTLSTMKRNFIVVQLHDDKSIIEMERIDNQSEPLQEKFSKKPSSTNSQIVFGDTSDLDSPQESEFFDSRQQFLNFCQTNHFQFDELRRAKHSTMMVLFHLHNPSAPKFLQQCGSCYREITHGIRYHCNNCSNFDLCQDCYRPVVTGLWAQRDSRFAHDRGHTFTPIDMEAASNNSRSRKEVANSLKAHLKLLIHCVTCKLSDCTVNNCARMKKLIDHMKVCGPSLKKNCKICARLLSLLSMHARLCTIRNNCPVPFCDQIRKRNKRLRQQQHLMDDRRRKAQNNLHRDRQTKGQKLDHG